MADEKRLIDANAFYKMLEEIRQDYLEEETMSSDFAANVIETVQDEYLANAPTVDAVEVVHGRWLSEMHGNSNNGTCSACGSYEHAYAFGWNYCPDCGAKMDKNKNP